MNQSSNAIVGCDAVNSHISKPIPTVLWHYTSFAGFRGIITSKQIWASEYRFLNDREEVLHAKKLALELVEQEPEFVGKVFPARDFLRKSVNIAFATGYMHEERLRIMVASFSEEGDLLSQWRGYADNSRGVSLGLDLRSLRPPSHIGTVVTFAPCIYGQDEKRALVKAVFSHFRIQLQDWWDSVANKAAMNQGAAQEIVQQLISGAPKELHDLVVLAHSNLQFDLLRIAPLLKDSGFSEEKEWRFVLPWETIKLPIRHPIQFRSTPNALIPYIAFPLNQVNQEGPIFCRDVLLGSGSHPSAEVGVNLFLHKEGISLLGRRSKIPYRPS